MKKLPRYLPFLLLLLASVGRAAELDTFFRALETGRFSEAEKMIPGGGASDPQARYLQAQVAFHKQDYAGARALLAGKKPPGVLGAELTRFQDLANQTLEMTKNFKTISSKYFEFHYAPGKDEVLTLYAADVLEGARENIGSALGVRPEEKLVVEFYPTWKSFMAVSTLSEKEIRTTGTIALCKFHRLMLTTPRALVHGYSWMDTMAHEYTHYLINRATDARAPVWLHEGIAKFFESHWSKERREGLDVEAEALLSKRRREGTLIPFERFHPSIAKLPSAEDAAVAFAQAYSFVRYLWEEKGGGENLRRVLDAIRTGASAEGALDHTYGRSFESLQKDWTSWLARVPSSAELPVKPRKIELRDEESPEERERDPTTESHPKAAGWARLGDLLRERGRLPAAMTEYEKADRATGGTSEVLLNKLSEVALALGNEERALTFLDRAEKASSSYPSTYLRRGRLRAKRKDWAGAEKDFLRAISINPFDPAAHEGLREVSERRGDARSVEREKKALSSLLGG